MQKPQRWKYKTGKKAGKLTPKAREYLSFRLKEYWKRKIIIKREKKKEIKPVKKISIPRIRQQYVENYRGDFPPYFFSLRAITINPEITKNGLKIALRQIKQKVINEFKINLYEMEYTPAREEKPIGEKEDKMLNDYGVYVELFLGYANGKRDLSKIYKVY